MDWRSAPFAAHFIGVESSAENEETLLPFLISGATQQGREHQLSNQNNQDAVTFRIAKNHLFGIVCDGCTGTSRELMNEFSNNDVGAKLTCVILSQILQESIDSFKSDATEYLDEVMHRYVRRLQALRTVIGGRDCATSFVHDFLTTTILGFVIKESRYVVFHYGDGFCALNGEVTELRDSGSYVSSYLMRGEDLASCGQRNEIPHFRVIVAGNTPDVESILIATDGMLPIIEPAQTFLGSLHKNLRFGPNPPRIPYLLPAFRKFVLAPANPALCDCPQDDASFLILSRDRCSGDDT